MVPSCHTTSLPWQTTSAGDELEGMVPPTAVTKGDCANEVTPRLGFGLVITSGPKSPEATRTVFPSVAACLKSFSDCRMRGWVDFDGRKSTDRLITETSLRFTR